MDQASYEKLFDVRGRVAIVTGGTRGIGRAIAEGFVCGGAKVVVASRKAEACGRPRRICASWARERGDAVGVPAHMGDLDAAARPRRPAVDRFGGVDIVVNNAANALTQPLGAFTPEAWQKSFDVNLRGPVFLVQAALPHLERSEHAAIVNVISAGAFLFSANVAMYGAAKAALMSFTRSMAADFAPRRHPGERARARHRRHRHGARQHSRGAAVDGERELHAPRRAAPTRWSARCSTSRPTRRAS